MLFLLQIALGIAFLCYLVLAFFDLIHGMYHIVIGLILLAVGLTLQGIAFILKLIHPAPTPVAPPVVPRRVVTWKVVP